MLMLMILYSNFNGKGMGIFRTERLRALGPDGERGLIVE